MSSENIGRRTRFRCPVCRKHFLSKQGALAQEDMVMRHMLQCSTIDVTEDDLEPSLTSLNESDDVGTHGIKTDIQTKKKDSKNTNPKRSKEESTPTACKNKSVNDNTTKRKKSECLLDGKVAKFVDKKLNHKLLKKVRFQEIKKTFQRREESPCTISPPLRQKRTHSQTRRKQINGCKKKIILKDSVAPSSSKSNYHMNDLKSNGDRQLQSRSQSLQCIIKNGATKRAFEEMLLRYLDFHHYKRYTNS